MATRFFFSRQQQSNIIQPAFGSGWHRTADAVRRRIYTFKTSMAMANQNIITSTAETVSFCLGVQYISDPLAATTLSGTIKGQCRCQESNAGLNATIAIRVAKCAIDGTSITEILAIAASDNTAATPPEFATSLTNRKLMDSAESASISLTSTGINAGDRLIIELGMRESNTTASRNSDLSLGDDSANDLAEDETTTTANNPWVEFSQTLTFLTVDNWQPNFADQIRVEDEVVDYSRRPY